MTKTELQQRKKSGGIVSVRERILDKPFASFGEQLLAIRDAGLHGRDYRVDHRLLELNRRALGASGASEQVPADGGFLVQPDFADGIATRMMGTGQLLAQYDYLSTNSNSIIIPSYDEQSRADGSRFGSAQGYWLNEAATVTASRPKYRNIQLTLRKLMALQYCSDELLQDANLQASGSAIQIAFANELAFKAEYATIFGDGSDKPLGMLAQGNNALVVVPKVSSQASATILSDNLVSMYTSLWGPSRRRAVWLASESVDSQLIRASILVKNMAGTDNVGGFPLYVPATSDDDFPRILGRPLLVCEYMPVIGTQGDIALIDPCEYLLADRGNPDFSFSIHVQFLSNQSVFKAVYRVDGLPKWHAPLQPYNGGSQLSAFVTLAAR